MPGYRLDETGFDSRYGQRHFLSFRVKTRFNAIPVSYPFGPGREVPFPGIRQPEREADQITPFNATDLQNALRFISKSAINFNGEELWYFILSSYKQSRIYFLVRT